MLTMQAPLLSRYLNQIKIKIKEITPIDLNANFAEDILLIDVRTEKEWLLGYIPQAVNIDRGYLEANIEKVAGPTQPIVLYCASGIRSVLAAENLLAMGYRDVSSLSGGYKEWVRYELPVTIP